MQPINDSRLQNQVIPAHPKTTGRSETSPYLAKTLPREVMSTFPEDIVTLAADQSSIVDSVIIKKPSIPVTAAEKKALRNSFSVYV